VGEECDDGTAISPQSGFVSFFIVGCARGPAFPDEALPFVGQRADGGVVAAAFLLLSRNTEIVLLRSAFGPFWRGQTMGSLV